jgi:hypothetical protein
MKEKKEGQNARLEVPIENLVLRFTHSVTRLTIS